MGRHWHPSHSRPARRAVCPECGKIVTARQAYGETDYRYPRHMAGRRGWMNEDGSPPARCKLSRGIVPEAMLSTETGGFQSEATRHLPPETIR